MRQGRGRAPHGLHVDADRAHGAGRHAAVAVLPVDRVDEDQRRRLRAVGGRRAPHDAPALGARRAARSVRHATSSRGPIPRPRRSSPSSPWAPASSRTRRTTSRSTPTHALISRWGVNAKPGAAAVRQRERRARHRHQGARDHREHRDAGDGRAAASPGRDDPASERRTHRRPPERVGGLPDGGRLRPRRRRERRRGVADDGGRAQGLQPSEPLAFGQAHGALVRRAARHERQRREARGVGGRPLRRDVAPAKVR